MDLNTPRFQKELMFCGLPSDRKKQAIGGSTVSVVPLCNWGQCHSVSLVLGDVIQDSGTGV